MLGALLNIAEDSGSPCTVILRRRMSCKQKVLGARLLVKELWNPLLEMPGIRDVLPGWLTYCSHLS